MRSNCQTCFYLRCEISEIWKLNFFTHEPIYFTGEMYYYWCKKTYAGVHTFKKDRCIYYIPLSEKLDKYVMDCEYMVKISELPTEKDRVDLSKLPQTAQLLAISEEMVAKQAGKTGGLVIQYVMKSNNDFVNMEFPQKYSALSGKVLYGALSELGMQDTVELQQNVCEYKLIPMRLGFPRYIPFRIVSEIEETTSVEPVAETKGGKRKGN